MARRARAERETTDYLDMLRRMIAAAGRRVGNADEVELGMLLELRHDLDVAIAAAVDAQRDLGRSWAHIAAATGTTRQGAFKRWAAPKLAQRELVPSHPAEQADGSTT